MDKEQRIAVFRETQKCANEFRYTNDKGESKDLYREDYGMKFSDGRLFSRPVYKLIATDKPKYGKTEISVERIDCLVAAQQLVDDGYNPAVLNMASFKQPGGGVKNGSAAQEENLCRRTNLYKSISKFEKNGYPLDINWGAIYSPVVTIFRKTEAENYGFMDEPYVVDFITAAAIKHPKLNGDGTLEQKTRDILKNKVRQILNVGLYYRNDSLVLGAFGCGAYGTPPIEMAKIFREVLGERFYRGAYKKIVFAVLDDHNAHREHNPEGNFKPFCDILEMPNR